MNNHFVGIVESRDDVLKLGRCKVRIVGMHTPDKTLLPTEDLPWAIQVISNSASMNGIGNSPTNYVEGSTVLVVFADEDRQIPIILGSLIGIPQENSKLIDSLDDGINIDFDDEGTEPVSTESVAENPEEVNPNIVNIPPATTGGLAALEKAIVDGGITSKYARASILGICLVESNFKTSAENLNYSKKRLIQVFPSIFKNDPQSAEAVSGKPENIAEVIYGPIRGKGKQLGNDTIGDGFKYRGRGFVQLTGKFNYKKYSSVAGVDLDANPDALLNEDVAARVTVQYFKDRVSVDQGNPGYINSAIKAVGHNSPDIYDKKIAAYQKFLGETPSPTLTDKTTDDSVSTEQHKESFVNGVPVSRSESLNYGFSDPKFKYPLKAYLNEPDTNRLARGRFNNTIVNNKDSQAIKNIPVADGTSWSQPISPYNSQYPFNHVYESESGHVQEFDDTPGNERIHTYHRKGTFDEIDCNGSKVSRIVGDKYEIVDRDGYIYITGDANITVAGNINIISQSNTNIKVHGDANLNIHGNSNTNVAGNHSITVGGTYAVKAANIKLESSNMDISVSNYKLASSNQELLAGNYKLTVNDEASYSYNGDVGTFIGANTYARHNLGIDYSCPADPPRTSDVDCSSIDEANLAGTSGLGAPVGKLNTVNPKFNPLNTPIRNASKIFIYETPEELTGNQPVIKDNKPEMQTSPVEPVKPNAVIEAPVSCDAFKSMASFPTSLVLHTDSTGYNWTLGKLLRGRKLKDVTVRGVKYSKADIVCNLKTLCENVLGKINEKIGRVDKAWEISSCYRTEIPPGGSATSQHLSGQAVDFNVGGNKNYQTIYDWAKELSGSLSFDQCLLEYLDSGNGRLNWIHISYKSNGNRKQVLTFLNHRTNNQGLKKLG